MEVEKYKKLIKETVISPLKEILKELKRDCGYTSFSVWICEVILTSYIKRLNKVTNPSDEEILKIVKKAVLSLNKLNDSTQGCLIDTEVREAIYEIIQNSAIDCGLKNYDEDITEEWRDW